MSTAEQLQALAEHLRASGTLGRSPLMRRLFDFLIDCSIDGRTPKETEVAAEVFGKGAGVDVSQDATVRVYVHKLRHKLEEYYSTAGRTEEFRLELPKGGYRFVVTRGHDRLPASPATADSAPPPAAAPPRPRRWLRTALAVSLGLNAVLLLAALLQRPANHVALPAAAASNPVWSRILQDDRPIVLALGDYYIFAETGNDMEVKRLVREFAINSSADLDQYLQQHPELADRYFDMQLKYLPTSAAYAMRDLMPLLAGANRRVRVTLASELDTATLKSADIIYMGYLSGMGMLGDLVFMGSRFQVGDSFDELVDRTTGTRYISQAAMPAHGDQKYHDYGYFATFAGPTGNQIVVIAGTRDVAVMRTAENVTQAATLATLPGGTNPNRSFEALYDVFAMNGTDMASRLLVTGAIDTSRIWTEEAPARGPGVMPARVTTATAQPAPALRTLP